MKRLQRGRISNNGLLNLHGFFSVVVALYESKRVHVFTIEFEPFENYRERYNRTERASEYDECRSNY